MSEIPPSRNSPPQTQAPPARPAVQGAVVETAPTSLTGQQVEGRVVASNPATQELRISTPAGEVLIKTPTPLPIDAKVIVDIFLQKAALTATVTLLRQQATVTEAQQPLAAKPLAPIPLPPLQEGSVVQAFMVPDKSPVGFQPTAMQSLLTPEGALETLTQMRVESLAQNATFKLPDVIKDLLAAPDLKAAFGRLPEGQKQEVITFLSKSETQAGLKIALPAPAPSVTESIDSNLLQITRAQMAVRLTQGTMTPTTAASPEKPSLPGAGIATVKNLLPLLETLLPETTAAGKPPAIAEMAASLPKNMFSIKIVKILPEGAPPAPLQPGEMRGKTEPPAPGGFPVIRTDQGRFVLKNPASLPLGSTVVFEAEALSPDQALESTGYMRPDDKKNSLPAFNPMMDDGWPALEETFHTISRAAPDAAMALRNSLPSPTPSLPPTALFFLAALRAGGVEKWLGENTLQLLRDGGKRGLLEQLEGDFSRISSQSKTLLPGDWRAISMPMLYDEHISQMQFFVRRQQEQEEENDRRERKKAMTRFILNLRLSRIGDLQLDGLLFKQRLDVILRSLERFPLTFRQDLMRQYALGLEQVNLQGQLSFQTRQENWVTIALPQQAGTIA